MRSDGFEIQLLTGFLGSGKTTLLRSYLASEDALDVGVVVNEIGEIDVDGAVLAQSAEKVPLALLTNGCICCAADGDLAGTIAMLQEERARRGMPPLRRVIVETSGAARPGPVMRGLQLLGSLAKTTCVSTFDARDWRRAMQTREGRAQIAGAQRIVITKLDCATDEAANAANEAARTANPLAQLIATSSVQDRARVAFTDTGAASEASASSAAPDYVHGAANKCIRTAVVKFAAPVAYEELTEWLENAAGLLGDRLYRTKGFVHVRDGGDHVILVQGVGTTFAQPTRFSGHGTQSFLVLIGEQLDVAELQGVEPALPSEIALGWRVPPKLGRALHETLA